MGDSQSPMKGKFKRIGAAYLRISDLSVSFAERSRFGPTESCVFRAVAVAIRKSIAHEEVTEGIP
jgi:hypothetical protein